LQTDLEQDEQYMRRCLHLAQLGEGRVAPNPMVGAVLVHKNQIIGEGYHKQFGQAHAEVACLAAVRPEHQPLIPEATLYVSLEPCSHFGKTPPCADLIIKHKIPRVVVGCADPFPQVSGAGIQKLRAAGIAVTVGVLEQECRALNKLFVLFQEQQRPYITLKWAQTADGKIAGENFRQVAISNEYTARLVHRLRSQHMSILVGTNTALFDDPELTTRLWPGNNPVRLVLDKTLRLPVALKLFDGRYPTIVFNAMRQEEHPNLIYHRLSEAGSMVQQIVQALDDLKMQSVLVEGGAQLLQSFIDEGLWDEAVVITNQQMALRKGVAAPQLLQHRLVAVQTLFSDSIHTYAHAGNTLL
jgi:diaminohydroxyphosphoribosylaminopyrimidine deaminase/5-amino-6-(5-phosphoribosylamino)uracil reductase